jgi:hypothetical protein
MKRYLITVASRPALDCNDNSHHISVNDKELDISAVAKYPFKERIGFQQDFGTQRPNI